MKPIVLLDVIGAIGDSLCSEPSVRYIKKNMSETHDLRILTNHPQIFKHLELPMALTLPELGIWDDNYIHIFNRHEMMIDGKIELHPIIQWAPPLLTHPIDFISMLMCRRTLLDEDKRIQIEFVDTTDRLNNYLRTDIEDLILIHDRSAAKDSTIRNLPNDYKNELVSRLNKEGHSVLVFGGDDQFDLFEPMHTPKYYKYILWDDICTLVSKAKLLITNDSAPVHMVSMFNTPVILLPTIRHPDRLLHVRFGSRHHNSVSLYKKLVLEDKNIPCDKYLSQCNWSDQEDHLEDYLPDINEVMDWVGRFTWRWQK